RAGAEVAAGDELHLALAEARALWRLENRVVSHVASPSLARLPLATRGGMIAASTGGRKPDHRGRRMAKITRRGFVRTSGALAAALATPVALEAPLAASPTHDRPSADTLPKFRLG